MDISGRFCSDAGMKKPIRIPVPPEQQILDEVHVRLLREEERPRYDELLDKLHYLKSGQLVGEQLRYVAEHNGEWLALLSWSAGSYHLCDRDHWIGWSDEQRRRRLPLVANNSRFLVLGGIDCPNLATRVMKLCLKRLDSDWRDAYAHGLLVVESFVDPQLFRGTAYKAGGWELLGRTKGHRRTRKEYYTEHSAPKQLYAKTLRRDARRLLCKEEMPEPWRSAELEPRIRCRTHVKELLCVREHFKCVDDYRNGSNWTYSHSGLLTLVFCAMLGGVGRGQRDLAEYAEDLSQGQLRALGFRRDAKTRKIRAPKETTFFRLLSRTDPGQLQEALLNCLDSLLGPESEHASIIIDGKALNSSMGLQLVSAFDGDSGRWLGTVAVEEKSNEIPAARELIHQCATDDTLVLTDALHTQTLTAREIVQECGADYFMTVKANQKGVLKNLRQIHEARKNGSFSPSNGNAPAG